MMRAAILSAAVAAVLVFPPEAPAAVFRMLTGDHTTINPDGSAYENGITFATVKSGSPFPPLISTQYYAGNRSLQIQVPTDYTGNKERFEYRIAAAADADGLHFDNARYSGFAFRLASPAAPFGSSMLFWQAWQGSPWGPPASLKLTSGGSAPFTIGLYIRNMATGPDSSVSDVKLWSSAMIQPDTWYAVVIYLSPRYTNNGGNIKLWINGVNYVNCTTNIGYDPGLVAGAYNGLDLKNGIYQPDSNNGHTVLFDQIIVADTYAEAAATPPSSNTPPTAAPAAATMLRNSFSDVDLSALANDSQTPSAQCLYNVSGATHGSVMLRGDGRTARYCPATDFIGAASYTYAVTDNGEDPRTFLHYSFDPSGTISNWLVTDNSGHLRDGTLLAVGAGSFAFSTNAPFPGAGSLQLSQSGGAGAARLSRFISDPGELNLSDSDWTFGCWFERAAAADHDFIFYLGTGDGFGGDGDELQLYGPAGSSTLALQHYNTNNVLNVNVASGANATVGQWHHAALVFRRADSNSGALHAYLDGAPFAVTNVAWTLPQQSPLVFGGHNATNSNLNRWFNGWLADIVVFTNALNDAEVARLASGSVRHFGGLSATNTVSVTITNYSPPRLTGAARFDGGWSMLVNGDAGGTYTIQVSTNLVTWAGLLTTNPASLPFRFMDTLSNGATSRFYRAMIGP